MPNIGRLVGDQRPSSWRLYALFALVAALLTGCGGDSIVDGTEPATRAGSTDEPEASEPPAAATEIPEGPDLALPARPGAPPEVTDGVPHIQLRDNASIRLLRRLTEWAFSLEGVVEEPSQTSLPGARALTVPSGLTPRPEAMMAGREFAHIHPGGSLHLRLPMNQAAQVVERGWGEWHPFALTGELPNFVMVYAPRNMNDLASVRTIIESSVDFSVTDGIADTQ